MIGNEDPLGLKDVAPDLPVLAGKGDFKVRVATRSSFYEVQAEVKIKEMVPPKSRYSVLEGSSKINPFALLAKSLKKPAKKK
jgi:hypothetical protein